MVTLGNFTDAEGRTIWIVDAHRDDGKRFVVRADEKLTAFVGTESGNPRLRQIVALPSRGVPGGQKPERREKSSLFRVSEQVYGSGF